MDAIVAPLNVETAECEEAGCNRGTNHPNIARVLDGGSTSAREPSLVMEFVAGIPWTNTATGTWLHREVARSAS